MSDTAQTDIGLFPVSYLIGNDLAGAPTLLLNLLVAPPTHSVTGSAHIVNQSLHPPLNLHSHVHGQYAYLGVVPTNEGRILISAQGHNGNTTNFKLHLVLSHDWKKGIANYSYLDGSKWVEVDNVPAKLNPELKSRYFPLPLEPGPVILPNPPIMALYGVPIQSAIASGDLAHMKTLAAYAKQQLDAQPQLRKELDALKAEITKLDRK
ncbi:hypothetical protein HNO92_004650 [Chromobacterium alkanivorans]|uniref:DUF1842 domain-containing protein n=1 Tax=Chromobacterium TaxID=535 RepID=UPI0006543231|nr:MULTISPECIES: DUF1842 domain-containing protein [Chromobacterium]KMN81434.1 hypothetical protein VK98_13150 [Chromobacterium sp. LK11]MBN3002992.1 DUF1842 domain-containing protein [Chromobacterium alkanivorans]MCS3803837.1 hypothetical protein [Chromobacterium alkanivorans]MCS3818058.1 hypothetical protein [Chromobacterium alkanivorans]MCS3876296.1 hypothetical protein [Chromobacterium alkanivorans]